MQILTEIGLKLKWAAWTSRIFPPFLFKVYHHCEKSALWKYRQLVKVLLKLATQSQEYIV